MKTTTTVKLTQEGAMTSRPRHHFGGGTGFFRDHSRRLSDHGERALCRCRERQWRIQK